MYANFDRYTGKQVGETHVSYCDALNAKRGFRCITCQRIKGCWIECI